MDRLPLGQLKGVTPAPAYDLLNTSLHISGDVFGLNEHLSPDIDDFERFGERIGLVENRVKRYWTAICFCQIHKTVNNVICVAR